MTFAFLICLPLALLFIAGVMAIFLRVCGVR